MRRVPLLLSVALLGALTACTQAPPVAVGEQVTIYCTGADDPTEGCVEPPAPLQPDDVQQDGDEVPVEDEAPDPEPRGPRDQRAFAWADTEDRTPCLTFVQHLTPRAAMARLVEQPVTPVESPAEVDAWRVADGGGDAAYAGRLGRWTWVLEDGGFACADPDTAAALSRGGTFVSVFWNIEYDNSFLLARDGEVLREFEMDFRDEGSGAALPQERGLDWEASSSAGLALQRRLTGTPAHDLDWYEQHADVAVGFTT